MPKTQPKHEHFVPGGSGHCTCLCGQCFMWMRATYQQRPTGMCVCRYCPCGGAARLLGNSIPTVMTNA